MFALIENVLGRSGFPRMYVHTYQTYQTYQTYVNLRTATAWHTQMNQKCRKCIFPRKTQKTTARMWMQAWISQAEESPQTGLPGCCPQAPAVKLTQNGRIGGSLFQCPSQCPSSVHLSKSYARVISNCAPETGHNNRRHLVSPPKGSRWQDRQVVAASRKEQSREKRALRSTAVKPAGTCCQLALMPHCLSAFVESIFLRD